MEKQKLEIIERFVRGQLSNEEQVKFDSWNKDDANFRKEVKFQQDLQVVTKEDMKLKIKEQLEKQERKAANKGKRTVRRIILVVVGLGLIAAAIIGYQWEKKQKSPEGIYSSNYETYPNVYFPVNKDKSDIMNMAFTAYENGEFAEAARQMDERLKTSSSNELKFYQAIAYAEIGNFPLAIKNLEDIKRFQSDYTDEAYWYLGLFYLKMQNTPSAVRYFQDYIEITDNEKLRQKAIKIVKNLI
jgi:tetratricopeptide (TPR) repeat protein